MNETAQQLEYLIGKRKRANFFWKIFLTLAIICLLEVPLPPVPPQMALPLMALFFLLTINTFYVSKRMPIREALLLSQLHQDQLSLTILCSNLDVDIQTAKAIIRRLERQGLIQVDSDTLAKEDDLIYKVQGTL